MEEDTAFKLSNKKMDLFYVIDQIGQKRFINSYLSKLTIKGFNFDMSKYNDDIKKMLDEYNNTLIVVKNSSLN